MARLTRSFSSAAPVWLTLSVACDLAMICAPQNLFRNRGDEVSKMIPYDSFSRSFQTRISCSPQVWLRRGEMESFWNRFHRVNVQPIKCSRPQPGERMLCVSQAKGGYQSLCGLGAVTAPGSPKEFPGFLLQKFSGPPGGVKSLGPLGPVTARVSCADFFCRGGLLIIFRNQTIQTAPLFPAVAQGKHSQWLVAGALPSACRSRQFPPNYFPVRRLPLLLGKTPRNSGWGGWS